MASDRDGTPLGVGDTVEVVGGKVFVGQRGRIRSIAGEQIQIIINVVGQPMPVHIDSAYLKRVDA